MELIALIGSYGGWSWIVLGLVLLGLELVLPGGVLLWLGVAAIVTGLNTLLIGLSVPLQWVTFGALSLISVGAWMLWSRKRYGRDLPSESPLLNRRTARYMGREVVLAEPINDGFGRIQIEDSFWQVTGPDLAQGTRVRIVGAQGSVLIVEATAPLD